MFLDDYECIFSEPFAEEYPNDPIDPVDHQCCHQYGQRCGLLPTPANNTYDYQGCHCLEQHCNKPGRKTKKDFLWNQIEKLEN